MNETIIKRYDELFFKYYNKISLDFGVIFGNLGIDVLRYVRANVDHARAQTDSVQTRKMSTIMCFT